MLVSGSPLVRPLLKLSRVEYSHYSLELLAVKAQKPQNSEPRPQMTGQKYVRRRGRDSWWIARIADCRVSAEHELKVPLRDTDLGIIYSYASTRQS